eukprot:3405888-Rhodomonas_salina.1
MTNATIKKLRIGGNEEVGKKERVKGCLFEMGALAHRANTCTFPSTLLSSLPIPNEISVVENVARECQVANAIVRHAHSSTVAPFLPPLTYVLLLPPDSIEPTYPHILPSVAFVNPVPN